MSKKFKLALGVMTLVVALVFGKEGWHFYQLLAYAKETQGEDIKQLVMEAKNSLTLASLQKNHAVAYNQAEGLIIYVVNGEVAEYKVDEDVSQYWDSNAPLYDVCDTAQWTLGALNRTIQKAMQKTYKRGLVVKLTRLDRMGRVKDELQNSFQQIKFFAVSYKHIQLTKTNIGIFFYRRFSCPDHTPADQE